MQELKCAFCRPRTGCEWQKPRLTMAPAKSKLGCGVSQCWSTWLSVYEALGWILSPRGVKVRHRYLCPESSGGSDNLSGLHHYSEPRHTVCVCARSCACMCVCAHKHALHMFPKPGFVVVWICFCCYCFCCCFIGIFCEAPMNTLTLWHVYIWCTYV